MYNLLKNKIYSNFYPNFVKKFYKQVSEIDNIEEVYWRENKLVVLVKDEEIGRRIYEIIKSLKDRNERIFSRSMSFKIDKYITDNQNIIQSFCIDFKLEREINGFSKIEKLQELVSFVSYMQNKGYVLDDSRFENEKCSSISVFLSFFVVGDEAVKPSKGCIIKYIHYVLSEGGNFEEFYQKIVENNEICCMPEFPYALPVIKMCYNYYVTGNVPENIYDVLEEEKHDEEACENYYDSYLIASRSSFESNFALIEDNEEYTIYDENIKIYHNMCFEFKEFLKDNNRRLRVNRKQTIEQIDVIIIDFDGSIIGYKFLVEDTEGLHAISDKNFTSQCDIFDFMSAMSTYLFEVINRLYVKTDNEKNEFNIEKSIVYREDSDISFKVTNIKELFNLAISAEHMLKNQITTIFFKLYLEYLNQKYGNMHDEEQLLDKKEVRYLSPILAREFIHYALEEQTNYEVATREFYEFLYNTRMTVNKNFVYDSRFEYVPLITPFIFDYEAEKKYGIEIQKKMNETLSDGRILKTFSRVRKVSKVKEDEDSLRSKISKKMGDIEDEHVKIIGISEIVCSKEISADGMYSVIGYITQPIKGQQLTDEVLLNLSNKDFLKVAGYLYTKHENYYFIKQAVWMDNDFKFYINILDEEFEIPKYGRDENSSLIKGITHYLIERGYNSNAFVDVDFSKTGKELKEYLLDLANSFDAYCDEHGIYYDGGHKACPVCLKTKYFVPQDFEKNTSKIFEDLYAEHYSIDSRHNLKVYKTQCVDMAELEENIDKIVSNRLNSKELELGQDCFIPYKKAIDSNNRFIGYIYDTVQFKDDEADITVCNDLKDPQKLKNLARLMSLIRLILQIKEITKRDVGFIKNPFSHVFSSKSHKKQVQILNIDFLSQKGSVQDTLKWACEYVCEILASDTSIEADISDCSTDLDSILERLQNLSKDMTKHCSIHNMYYRSNYLFCPKCIDKVQMEHFEVEEVEKNKITDHKQDNEGGESVIYPYGDNLVAKVFKENIDYNLKMKVITRVMEKKDILKGINKKKLKYKFIIPKKLLVDTETHNFFGYTMKKVSGVPISSLRDKEVVKNLGITMKDVFEILITVGEGIETLHANNIYIGDLNGRNILFDTEKNVYFLDFDGMGVDDIAPEFCTDGYIDPVSNKNQNITMKDDWYSFAVQAFYYLTFTHPFNGIYSIEENGEEIILDVLDKMERRISLLGNHGMKAPVIAHPWDWMNEELKTSFLNIFEGDSRESIVPHLVRQYEKLYKGDKPYNKPIRINPKFIATELIPFGRDVVYFINHYAAVCKKDNEYYLSILVSNNEKKILDNIPSLGIIKNLLLTEDKKIAFVIYSYKVIAIDLKTNTEIYNKEILNTRDAIVNGSTLYFTGTSEGDYVIFQIDFMSNGDVKEQKIKFLTKQKTKRLCAKFNSKFILVKRASDTVDEIYCNSEKLCNMSCSSENSEYNIIYDDVTNLWLVVSSEGNGIVIKANGMYEKFNIQESINDMNIENITFDKGMIYIPNQDYLHIVNTNGQITTKKMECHKIMTPNSKLYDLNTKGFSVATEDMLYEVRRG